MKNEKVNRRTRRVETVLSRILHEPILQFLSLGLIIWLFVGLFNFDTQRYHIEVGRTERAKLVESYGNQFGILPNKLQIDSLVNRYVDDEIAYREGKAMGLDRDDEIIRRRIIQKYRFLTEDQTVPNSPSDAQLKAWYVVHRERYISPPRVSFSQIYFSPDRDNLKGAWRRAEAAMSRLAEGARASDLGDSFPGQLNLMDSSREELERVFGNSQLVDRVFNLPIGRWTGPFQSGFGWHLVRAVRYEAGGYPAFDDIRGQVRADYLDELRQQANLEAEAKVRLRYRVIDAEQAK